MISEVAYAHSVAVEQQLSFYKRHYFNRDANPEQFFEEGLRTRDHLRCLNTQESHLVAGEIGIDMATHLPLPDELKLELIDEASTSFNTSTAVQGQTKLAPLYLIRAQRGLANSDSLEWVLGNSSIPPTEVTAERLRQYVAIGELLMRNMEAVNHGLSLVGNNLLGNHLIGLGFEHVIEWALQRFLLQEGIAESQIILPSTYSEDELGHKDSKGFNVRFDSKVLSQTSDQKPNMTHKIQAKIHHDNPDAYAQGIVIVQLDDLRTDQEKDKHSPLRIVNILQELISDATLQIPAVKVISDRLDQRGEAILDCLDAN